jgi:hypothetical protein
MNDLTNNKHDHLLRQLDLIPIKCLDEKITIIGAGAIGSFTALSLVKMGFTNLTVFDDDKIDVENLNCQFFRHSDIGKPKVVALQELIHDFTGNTIEIVNDRWNGTILDGIIIAAVDSMEVRKSLFDTHYKKGFNTKLIIDPRMGAETSILASYSPLKIEEGEKYSKTLYSDSEAIQERCTAKSTMYCVLGLSGMVCSLVKAVVTGNDYPRWKVYDIAKFDMV